MDSAWGLYSYKCVHPTMLWLEWIIPMAPGMCAAVGAGRYVPQSQALCAEHWCVSHARGCEQAPGLAPLRPPGAQTHRLHGLQSRCWAESMLPTAVIKAVYTLFYKLCRPAGSAVQGFLRFEPFCGREKHATSMVRNVHTAAPVSVPGDDKEVRMSVCQRAMPHACQGLAQDAGAPLHLAGQPEAPQLQVAAPFVAHMLVNSTNVHALPQEELAIGQGRCAACATAPRLWCTHVVHKRQEVFKRRCSRVLVSHGENESLFSGDNDAAGAAAGEAGGLMLCWVAVGIALVHPHLHSCTRHIYIAAVACCTALASCRSTASIAEFALAAAPATACQQ